MSNPAAVHRLDLNLLKVFRAVYESGQTTIAAENLGLTQPAVSQALGRLRALIGDPLFVSSRAGMEPTARAHELAAPVLRALDEIAGAVERAPSFEPATARRRFRVGMLDYGVIALAPAIAREISRRAPGIVLEINHVAAASAPQMLAANELDLATGPFRGLPKYFMQRPLFSDNFAVIARKGHPHLGDGLDLQTFASLGHVDVTYATTESDLVDRLLRRHQLSRTKSITTPHFVGAFHIVGGSDLIAVVPRRLAEAYRSVAGIQLHAPPIDLPPLAISSLVHRRHDADEGVKWLRGIIEAAAPKSDLRK